MSAGKYRLPDISGRSSNKIQLSSSLQNALTSELVTARPISTYNIKSCEELAQPDKGVRERKRESRLERSKTKGDKWFNLPAPEMTESLKNDLTVLQMRKVLDPKRFYKGPDIRGALPKYFQCVVCRQAPLPLENIQLSLLMGRIVENAADFYSSRIPKKQRKKTIVDELLADEEFRRYNKAKYTEIQSKQPRGLSKAYKKMKKLKKKKH